MARIIKTLAGCAPRLDGNGGQYEWIEPGQALDVDPVTAEAIRRIDGFTEIAPEIAPARPAKPKRTKVTEPADTVTIDE